MKKLKVKQVYFCDGHFKHEHRSAFVADTCTFFQVLFGIDYLHLWYMRKFKPDRWRKIEHAMKGSNRRAMQRRIQRGGKPI